MDFIRTPEQIQLTETLRQFAQTTLNHNLRERDCRQEFDHVGWRQCSEYGIQGLPIPTQYGGRGADPLTTILALEALGYGCQDNGLNFAINAHLWGCTLPILTFGNESQKQQYLPRLTSGEWIGALAMSERGAGSDAYSLQTTAQLRDDGYILNGGKMFVTNAPIADVIVVLATVDPAKGAYGITGFLLHKGMPGLTVSPALEKMGLRTAPMGEVFLQNCAVPVANRLGKEGAGMALFSHAMQWERGFILACAVGAMRRQLECCLHYAKTRQQFGQPICQFPPVANKLVDMQLRLETARFLLYKVGWLKRQGKAVFLEGAMAKLFISEAWVQSCQDAIQIHGGYGYLTAFEVERDLRDALGSKLYSGTSEMQRQMIAQWIGIA